MPTPAYDEQAKQEALEITEDARELAWQSRSLVAEMFMGRFDPDLIFPFPLQDANDQGLGDEFLKKIEKFLRAEVDPEAIEKTGVMPEHVLQGAKELGLFGMKIPQEYGGLGFSQINYSRVAAMITSYCGALAVWISAHQSIGVPQPLKLFGTQEQKKKYLPRLAQGAISAFALTEPGVGSDPAKMATTATPIEHGDYYLLNGEKLWCTNGPDAEILVVMARTPSITVNGREKKQITAFIVETNTPGFEIAYLCEFMGLRGISNGLLRFRDVRVPKENIIGKLGQGLKIALTTLNNGRLTLPAGCCGAAKKCLEITRDWANSRVQWGAPIGKHELVASKIASMAAATFAMESVTWYASALADMPNKDIRLEAAIAKLFASEQVWKIADMALQIRGGRGYETAASLARRGEKAIPMERILRDLRINLLIEGSSEIMRLFIAREALDPHLGKGLTLFDPHTPWLQKIKTALGMGLFYLGWYPRQVLFWGTWPLDKEYGSCAKEIRFARRASHALARKIFHAILCHGRSLEKKQQILARAVDIGMDLLVMMATLAHAKTLVTIDPQDQSPTHLAQHFCDQAKNRIRTNLKSFDSPRDRLENQLGTEFLAGKMLWLEEEIIQGYPLPGLGG